MSYRVVQAPGCAVLRPDHDAVFATQPEAQALLDWWFAILEARRCHQRILLGNINGHLFSSGRLYSKRGHRDVANSCSSRQTSIAVTQLVASRLGGN